MSVPTDLWCVEAKPSQIQQILMNLGSNSTYAMQDGGCLTIEAANVSLNEPRRLLKDTLPPGRYVRLTVADTGAGIPEEHLPRVLEPFFTTKPPGKGTGMGLASVYGIVGAHGAYLDISSEIGRGTAITVYLQPSQRTEATPQPSPRTSEPPRGHGETVLLVDDEQLVLKATGRMLAHLGYRAVSFAEPIAALEAFRREPDRFDLVVSDRSMPDLDGAALLREVARIRPGTPSILCTGFADLGDGDDWPFDILSKPCRVADLARAVSRALGGQLQA